MEECAGDVESSLVIGASGEPSPSEHVSQATLQATPQAASSAPPGGGWGYESSASPAVGAPARPARSPTVPLNLLSLFFYKEGDDLLQDVGTTMLLHELNVAWAVAGTRFFTPVYAVYPLRGPENAGFLECLPDAQPVSEVRRPAALSNSAHPLSALMNFLWTTVLNAPGIFIRRLVLMHVC